MRLLARTCLLFGLISASPRVAAQGSSALALAWDVPAECGDESRVFSSVSQRLGERAAVGTRVEASGRIERTAGGYALALRTPTGERRLEAASCDELIESAAVILALLIDPRVQEPEAEPDSEAEAEPEPEPEPTAESDPTSASGPSPWSGLLRAEVLADIGLLPRFGLAPGLALGAGFEQTYLEVSASYFPTHDVSNQNGIGDVGDLRAFNTRFGACQLFFRAPAIGPCVFGEYTRITGGGSSELMPREEVDVALWSLLVAARLTLPIQGMFGWMFEVGIALPTRKAGFTVEGAAVHETSDVVGRLRTGLELRF